MDLRHTTWPIHFTRRVIRDCDLKNGRPCSEHIYPILSIVSLICNNITLYIMENQGAGYTGPIDVEKL